MQKAVSHLKAILGRIMFIGLSIQIVLGLLWMCCSFTGVQWFAESYLYVQAGETLLCDEYMGILYPFILMLTGRNEIIICLLQVTVALLSGGYFLDACGVRSTDFRIWGSLVFLTYPMAMQCHMAILPNSFAFSCFLLLIACAVKAAKLEQRGRVWKLLGLHVAWLGAALLQPDYLYLGAVPVGVLFVYTVMRYRKNLGKRLCYQLLLGVVFAGLIMSVNHLTQREGAYGRGDRSFEAAIFQRVAWSSLAKYYMDWPTDIQDAFDTMEFFAAADYPENLVWHLMPQIEEKLGVENARQRYLSISSHVIKNNYYQLIYEIGWDALGNVVPLLATDYVLEGRGYTSYCIRNYETLRQECPVLTKYYMQYSMWWFVVGIIMAAVLQTVEWIRGLQKSKKTLFPTVICLLSGCAIAAWYTLSCAGMWDYKKGLFAGALWMSWMVIRSIKGMEEEL